ncbi:unnamed protein product, partial [Prorocentrum cordatum]
EYSWAAIVGDCTLDGDCMQSPNYPQKYDANQACTLHIDLRTAVPIAVESFTTESGYDKLTVNGVVYSGFSGPSGITPSASISWTSDHSLHQTGWRLCMPGASSEWFPPTPVPLEYSWAAIVGDCTLDGDCMQSPNYPQKYDANQACILHIDLRTAVPITVESFTTESGYDKLTVNGVVYSGFSGPSGITPSASISWTSDHSLQQTGWRLCMPGASSELLPPTPAPPAPRPPPPVPTPSPNASSHR